jgi:hypothetical protein
LIEGFPSIFMRIFHIFPLVDRPSLIKLVGHFLHLNSLSFEQDKLHIFELISHSDFNDEYRCYLHKISYLIPPPTFPTDKQVIPCTERLSYKLVKV